MSFAFNKGGGAGLICGPPKPLGPLGPNNWLGAQKRGFFGFWLGAQNLIFWHNIHPCFEDDEINFLQWNLNSGQNLFHICSELLQVIISTRKKVDDHYRGDMGRVDQFDIGAGAKFH